MRGRLVSILAVLLLAGGGAALAGFGLRALSLDAAGAERAQREVGLRELRRAGERLEAAVRSPRDDPDEVFTVFAPRPPPGPRSDEDTLTLEAEHLILAAGDPADTETEIFLHAS